MNQLSVIGLSLDLAGVLLLGLDLVRIQRNHRRDARDRLLAFNEVFEGKEELEEWMAGIARRADWRETQWEEGRSVYLGGTFDPDAAKDSIKEITGEISQLGIDIARLAELQIASAKADERAAGHSLIFSFAGLGLIVIGFALQIVAQL